MVIVHHPYRNLVAPALSSGLLSSIPDCVVVTDRMRQVNNLVFREEIGVGDGCPFAIIFQSTSVDETDMEMYLQTCGVFHGHLHLQVLMYDYPNNPNPKTHTTTIVDMHTLINTSNRCLASEDNLEILLRSDVPDSCYINILPERASKITSLAQIPPNYRVRCLDAARLLVSGSGTT